MIVADLSAGLIVTVGLIVTRGVDLGGIGGWCGP
jgi:hypothetical protein